MKSLDGQTVLVLGLGESGLARARWCARHGAAVRVADSRESPPQAAALAEGVPGATLERGFDPALLDGVQRVLKLCNLSPFVAEVFEDSNFSVMFDVHDSLASARREFEGSN